MATTTALLPVANITATSAPFTVEAGSEVGLYLIPDATNKAPSPRAVAFVERQTSVGWSVVLTLNNLAESITFSGIGEFRVRRPAQADAFGIDLVS